MLNWGDEGVGDDSGSVGGMSLGSGGGEDGNDAIGIMEGERRTASIVLASEGVHISSGMDVVAARVEGSGSDVTTEEMAGWRVEGLAAESEGAVELGLG